MKRLLAFVHSPWLALAVVLLCCAALLELTPHVVVYLAADALLRDTPAMDRLPWLAALAVGGVVLRYVFLGTGTVLSHATAFRMMRLARIAIAEKLARVPLGFFGTHSSGDLKKTTVDDVAALEGVFAHNLPDLASAVVVPVAAFAWLAHVLGWAMALVSLGLVPIAFAVQARVMGSMGDEFKKWHAAETRANESILEFLRGIAVLKSFDREAQSLERVRDGVYGIRDYATEVTERMMTGYALFEVLVSHTLLLVVPTAVAAYLAGWVDAPGVVLFVVLGAGMTAPLLKLMFLFGRGHMTKLGAKRIVDVLAADELTAGESDAPKTFDIEVRGVSFRYAEERPNALENVSIVVPEGTVTAIVGPSGSGKTTLGRMLVRSTDPDSGAIAIGGVDLRELRPELLTALVGRVEQATTLFVGSARENLLLAKPDATDDELERVTRAAKLHEVLARLPSGYDTELQERGGRLSGGERQRLGIARALLKDAPVLLLDEVTSNLDAETEHAVQQGISALAEGRTVIVIAHRLRSVVGCDQIVVLDDGAVVESGTHEELLARDGLYRELWDAQESARDWTLRGGAAP